MFSSAPHSRTARPNVRTHALLLQHGCVHVSIGGVHGVITLRIGGSVDYQNSGRAVIERLQWNKQLHE